MQHKSITTLYLRLTFNDFYISLKSFENTPDTYSGIDFNLILGGLSLESSRKLPIQNVGSFKQPSEVAVNLMVPLLTVVLS